MAPEQSKIASQKARSGAKKTCPECSSDMEMTRVVRSDGPSGMFWICTDYKCATIVSKAGVRLESLELQ